MASSGESMAPKELMTKRLMTHRQLMTLLALASVAVLVSAYEPYDGLTWLLEVGPVLIGVPLLFATRRSFPLTRLLYYLLFFHALILILGGHYTYARVPIGFWLQDGFDLARNHYDRLGHVAQGFVPAILAREILIRRSPLVPGGLLFLVVTSICLAFSACYELIEWGAAIVMGQGAESFLGTQGDVWDTQWDMFLALCGALTAQWSLGRMHDRQLDAVRRATASTSSGRLGDDPATNA
jgi:putative membrane protein